MFRALRPELGEASVECHKVDDMHNYNQMLRARGHFTHRCGKIDRFESHKYWLAADAQASTDFNAWGIKNDDIKNTCIEALMKRLYEKADVAAARGILVTTIAQARHFGQEVGHPLEKAHALCPGASQALTQHRPTDLSPMRGFTVRSDLDGAIMG
jgi:hypothetical protein